MPDWTIAIDTAMRNDFTCCSSCGRRLKGEAFFDVWMRSDGLAIPLAICTRCKTEDPAGAVVAALMAKRYGV